MKPEIILINPWIYDFAAYDLWSKPLGLLYLAAYLRKCGYGIHLIDCLDIHYPQMTLSASMNPPKRRLFGTGKFWKEKASKPAPLQPVRRAYSRYGITKELFIEELKRVKNPSAVLVTSLMSYWYPGVKEAISLAREVHTGIPIILGGLYAKICAQHARRSSGADYVAGEITLHNMKSVLEIFHRFNVPVMDTEADNTTLPLPAFDALNGIDYISVLTSTGCPYNCSYCASPFLYNGLRRRDPESVLEEIEFWINNHGVRDFAFYDDALLIDFERHLRIVLEGILEKNMNPRFHTPNAVHLREISPEVAKLLRRSHFRTIRLGLETSDCAMRGKLDDKVSEGDFERAVRHLKAAGFDKKEIGAYVLMGLPEQTVGSVLSTIRFVERTGASPYLVEYSPIPHTVLWNKAVEHSEYDITNEPLFHNNTLMPCWDESKREKVPELKRMVREIRQNL